MSIQTQTTLVRASTSCAKSFTKLRRIQQIVASSWVLGILQVCPWPSIAHNWQIYHLWYCCLVTWYINSMSTFWAKITLAHHGDYRASSINALQTWGLELGVPFDIASHALLTHMIVCMTSTDTVPQASQADHSAPPPQYWELHMRFLVSCQDNSPYYRHAVSFWMNKRTWGLPQAIQLAYLLLGHLSYRFAYSTVEAASFSRMSMLLPWESFGCPTPGQCDCKFPQCALFSFWWRVHCDGPFSLCQSSWAGSMWPSYSLIVSGCPAHKNRCECATLFWMAYCIVLSLSIPMNEFHTSFWVIYQLN